jgi:hypothetical protein
MTDFCGHEMDHSDSTEGKGFLTYLHVFQLLNKGASQKRGLHITTAEVSVTRG